MDSYRNKLLPHAIGSKPIGREPEAPHTTPSPSDMPGSSCNSLCGRATLPRYPANNHLEGVFRPSAEVMLPDNLQYAPAMTAANNHVNPGR